MSSIRRDNNPARPVPEVTFADTYTLRVGGERVELAWHGPNHSPDNIYIHFPDHDTLMFIDVVNAGWVPICNVTRWRRSAKPTPSSSAATRTARSSSAPSSRPGRHRLVSANAGRASANAAQEKLSTRRTSRLRNTGEVSQSRARLAANSPVSGRPELVMAAS